MDQEYDTQQTQGGGGEMEALRKEREEYLAGWQRARADYQNLKRDEEVRFEAFKKMCNEDMVMDLLAVFDSFDAARNALKDEGLVKELGRIEEQMRSVMKRYGVSEVSVAPHASANPLDYDAIEAIASDEPSGTILEVLQKGYSLNGKTIRPAKVKVAQ